MATALTPRSKPYVGARIIRAYPAPGIGINQGRDGYSVIYPDGYESWCPKDSFESVYREITPEEQGLIG